MEGIIIVNKPVGITSFDVIRELRKILKTRKIGHTGTLDPLAEGVLILCVGKATKLVQEIEGYNKVYNAGFELGYKTDTYDIEGKIISTSGVHSVSYTELENSIKKFIGDIKQVPPMYSAIKIDGQKLYDLARKGIEVERKARDININSIKILNFDGKKGNLRCEVSKGTYIRSLIFDIGEDLKCFATMTSLIREKVGNISLNDAYTLEEIATYVEKNDFKFMISVEDFFEYPQLNIEDEKNLKLFLNGNTVKYNSKNGRYRIYHNNEFIGLANINNNLLKGFKYF